MIILLMWSSCPFFLLKTIQRTNYLYWRQLSYELNRKEPLTEWSYLKCQCLVQLEEYGAFLLDGSHVSVRLYGKNLVWTHRREQRETVASRGIWITDLEDTLSKCLPGHPRRPSAMNQGDTQQEESPEHLSDWEGHCIGVWDMLWVAGQEDFGIAQVLKWDV